MSAQGTVAWTSVSETRSTSDAQAVEIRGPGSYSISVPEEAGLLEATVPGFWMPETLVGRTQEEVEVWLIPTGRIEGEVLTPAAHAAPAALRLELGPASFLQTMSSNPAAKVRGGLDCPVAERSFKCDVPQGFHDLRWHATGFASVLRWGVEVVAGQRSEVEPLDLIPGGAVLGFVELSDEVLPGVLETTEREIRVTLTVASQTPLQHDTRRRLAYLEKTVETGPEGSFQFTGLAPGRYRLTAVSEGLAASTEPILEIFEGKESRLAAPIVLETLVSQDLRISPPTTPEGRPWKIRLLHSDPRGEGGICVTSPSGDCRVENIPAGEYRLIVEDTPSSQAYDQPVLVARHGLPIDVSLPLVLIEGEITRGGDPARARIILSQGPTQEKLETYSDHGGRFSGYVSKEGPWEVAVALEARGVEVGLGTYEITKPADGSAFQLDLELADTTLIGSVLNHLGQPESRAWVQIYSAAEEPVSRGVTDREGRFRAWGLPEGTYRVRARASKRAARSEPIELLDDRVSRVAIRLPGFRQVEGRVFADGRPLTGATVTVVPELPEEAGLLQSTVVSGLGGTFQTSIAEGAGAVHLVILPPGLSARLVRRVLDGDPLEVSVDRWGGTLELRDSAGLTPGHGLRHADASVLLGPLLQWPILFGHSVHRRQPILELPQMTAGSYRFCSPDGKRCDEGELTVGGHLVLDLAGEPHSP